MEGILEKVVSCKSTLNHYTCPKGMMYLYFIIQIFSGNGDFFMICGYVIQTSKKFVLSVVQLFTFPLSSI